MPDASLEFDFRFILEGGVARARNKLRGTIDADAVILDGTPVSFDDVASTRVDGSRLIVSLMQQASYGRRLRDEMAAPSVLVLELSKGAAAGLKRCLDVSRSERRAALAQSHGATESTERGRHPRHVRCPSCAATVDAGESKPESLVHCEYCQTVFDTRYGAVVTGDCYGTCPECRRFDRVQSHAAVTFYFVLVAYGYSYRRVTVCDACAHRIFIRMLLVNLLFVFGVPSALWVKVKSTLGRTPALRHLPRATLLARAGKGRAADDLYGRLARASGDHPAVHYNQALSFVERGQPAEARASLHRALERCPTFRPATALLGQLEGAAP